ncbi:MAG TPA: FAD-dependent monooxygenase [Thermoanaerobaculia bacterium]|jgi:2-polyprenyl-6-methoxyphenol hydroxylase-like FAD-dependent oxidoreductase|nr:FAD-dependent monooxygenase [Thermoanaerobaculia bacterium]
MAEKSFREVDVLIVGAGLAGLSLARQLLLADPGKRILMVDRQAEIPPARQKVGEATVQVSGYYFSRVLDLEEHLLREHYLKYNLRFHWKTGRGAGAYEDYSQSYIRTLSNIATYQLDRNKLEAEILRLNRESPGFELIHPTMGLSVELSEDGPHAFRCKTGGGREIAGRATWVVDASGRNRFLARREKLERPSPIDHGSSFLWVDGLVDPERLTGLDRKAVRVRRERAALGHLPTFLATNHFCGEGFWFWVIPLHGRTSLGLVYDAAKISSKDVGTAEKLVEWICREFPLFASDLPHRTVVHHSGFTSFALDGGQTISADRWALVGEACRFSDPLYSPGGDLIAIYNTLIADAILTADPKELAAKVRLYEPLARAVFEAYVPSYAVSYATLGDQECFSLRYAWELTVYFAFYVFPFINDLLTDRAFLPGFLRRFGRLGPINQGIHRLLAAYYEWKKEHVALAAPEPVFFDFTEIGALRAAEKTFYKIGLGAEESRRVLEDQLANLEELARWTYAHVSAAVLDDPRATANAAYVRGIDVDDLQFDPEAMAACLEAACRETSETYAWCFDPPCMARFRTERLAPVEEPVQAVG